MPTPENDSEFRTILGIKFFQGSAAAAVDLMGQGGLLVVPAAPALKDLGTDAGYRDALVNADLALADSAFMVLAWNYMENDSVQRLSGLEYLRELLRRPDVRQPGNTVWVKASPASAARNVRWLERQGIDVPEECVYLAPMYGEEIDDLPLLELLEKVRPRHVVITVGGGTQERLGLYLKRRLSFDPAIHCTGAAIAFLSGDQVRIPIWADKVYLGWLFRAVWDPAIYIPRYWGARKLFALMRDNRDRLPNGTAGRT
jgi:N-acetylglucosaminyldiphosphoundecaprenol N-acetyl-beta-D-mannosaminyltransferase